MGKLKITFLNPNTEAEIAKHLPKIIAEALIANIEKDGFIYLKQDEKESVKCS
jgi:hypothetical protein